MKKTLPRKVSTKGVVKRAGLWYTIARYIFRPILEEIQRMSAETQAALDEMAAAVEANTTVTGSVVTLVNKLATQIHDAADDPEEVRALADKLKANTQAIADAVAANTEPEGGEEPAQPEE